MSPGTCMRNVCAQRNRGKWDVQQRSGSGSEKWALEHTVWACLPTPEWASHRRAATRARPRRACRSCSTACSARLRERSTICHSHRPTSWSYSIHPLCSLLLVETRNFVGESISIPKWTNFQDQQDKLVIHSIYGFWRNKTIKNSRTKRPCASFE